MLMITEFVAGFCNLGIGVLNINMNGQLGNFTNGNLIIGAIVTALGFLFLTLNAKIRKKIKKLKQEKTIHE